MAVFIAWICASFRQALNIECVPQQLLHAQACKGIGNVRQCMRQFAWHEFVSLSHFRRILFVWNCFRPISFDVHCLPCV